MARSWNSVPSRCTETRLSLVWPQAADASASNEGSYHQPVGEKMAVVVDRAFWDSLGEMRTVRDLSNAEIAWFVVVFSGPEAGRFQLNRGQVHFTTLTHAVEGLTGGMPVSLEIFEHEIRARMPQSEANSSPSQ